MRNRSAYVLFASILILALSACQASTPEDTPLPSSQVIDTPAPTNTSLPPTSSPTPLPPSLILLAPAEAEPGYVDQIQAMLSDVASQEGWRFQVLPEVSPAELQGANLVVVLPPYQDVQTLVTTYPDTQFLTVGIPDLAPAPNLSIILSQADQVSQASFIAGYLAATVTPDWRVGVITQVGNEQGAVTSTAFTNGVFYMCGLCRSVYPPFPSTGYPLYVELPVEAGQADWQSMLNYLEVWQVGTVYVQSSVAEPGLLSELAQAGINIIGGVPAPASLRENWVASIIPADPIQAVPELLPDLLAGEAGAMVEMPLVITDVNSDLLSPGRQRLVEDMMSDLLAGYIDTGIETANNP